MNRPNSISIKSVEEYCAFETKEYDLKDSQKLTTQIRDFLVESGNPTNISLVSLSEDRNQIIFSYPEGSPLADKEVTLNIDGHSGNPIINRIFTICLVGSEVEYHLAGEPLWYRYWVFRYLESRQLDGLVKVDRVEAGDLGEDFEVTSIEAAKVADFNSGTVKRYSNVIVRANYQVTDKDDTRNSNFGQVYPFVIVGDKYGYNQVLPFPYYRGFIKPEEDVELAFTVKDDVLFS